LFLRPEARGLRSSPAWCLLTRGWRSSGSELHVNDGKRRGLVGDVAGHLLWWPVLGWNRRRQTLRPRHLEAGQDRIIPHEAFAGAVANELEPGTRVPYLLGAHRVHITTRICRGETRLLSRLDSLRLQAPEILNLDGAVETA